MLGAWIMDFGNSYHLGATGIGVDVHTTKAHMRTNSRHPPITYNKHGV